MLDSWTGKLIKPFLESGAAFLNTTGVTANQLTIAAFFTGMLSLPFLACNMYSAALACILLNRIGDGLDGPLARINTATDAGGFLDITLDFIFYAGVVLGFALANPISNGMPASVLLFSFMGTSSSFLAFGIMAEKRKIKNLRFNNKGFFYLNGLAEGTETILFFVLCCLFPSSFPIFAWIFAIICFITTLIRVISGFITLSTHS